MAKFANFLKHYGMPRRSGRYPYGSGDNPYQHSGDILTRIDELRSQGKSEKEIAEALNLSTTQLRAQKSIAKAERRSQEVATAKALKADGKNPTEIARIMGYKNESSIRSLLNEDAEARMNTAMNTASFLKEQVDKKGFIDVGAGVESGTSLNISQQRMTQALAILQEQGYEVYNRRLPQVTNPGKFTTLKVLCPPGTKYEEVYKDMENIHSIDDYISYDGGDSFHPAFAYPASMDSKRLKIRYAEEGGLDKDGVIEIRRGLQDLTLGNAHYAQVRILVDDTHYLKGMAIYSDDLPPGVDVVFNTNKPVGTPALGEKNKSVLKPIEKDADNPFGSTIKEHGGQHYYFDADGKEHLGLVNKTREEGDWSTWSHELPAQFLSKQNLSLVKKQLSLASADKRAEFDEICSLTNPTVKKVLLDSFAEDCDSAAVHLKAAALPRQRYQVILPIPSLKDNEVYAPNYKDGEQVALIRYPHGGTFEIPILTVNNKHAEAKSVLGNAIDAVGINSKVAARLSGADFDGDTVMVIPTNAKTKITSTPPLKGLEGFDPKLEYGGKPEGTFKVMTKKNTQNEMGRISNLITDMTIKGATQDELARAVRHSMVVIDAAKHKLDYKQSELDNGIAALKKKYQSHYEDDGKIHEGVSTLISRAKSDKSVLKRVGTPRVDPETGELIYKEVREEYIDKDGKVQVRTQKSTKMAETKDAFSLVSEADTPMERAYAEYANQMKALANEARKERISTGKIAYSASAKEAYKEEVQSLDAKLKLSLQNAPRERQAQIIANSVIKAKTLDNPEMTNEEKRKQGQRALVEARERVGAKRSAIKITDREWEAIQSGAISENKLYQILNHTDTDEIRKRATPRASVNLSSAKINKIMSMNSSGYTLSEIAESMGISTSTVSKYLNN